MGLCFGREDSFSWTGKKVLITGGAGFIGRHLVKLLTDAGASVVVLDDFSTGKRPGDEPLPQGVECLEGSIADAAQRAAAMEGVDIVYNLAAIASVPKCEADPAGSKAVNFEAAAAFLKESPGPVVFASSAAIYGPPEQVPTTEDHRIGAISAYGKDKAAVDQAIRDGECPHGATALRFFNVYGQGQDPSSPYSGVLSIFAKRAQEDGGVDVLGDGLQTRDFVHVSDVVRALRLVGERLLAQGPMAPVAARAFNVCTGQKVTLLEVLEAMRRISGKELKVTHKPARQGDVKESCGAPEKLQAAIPWQAQMSLDDGLKDIL